MIQEERSHYTELLARKIKELGIEAEIDVFEDRDIFSIHMIPKSSSGYTIYMTITDALDVSLHSFLFYQVSEEKRLEVILELNRLNNIYRFLCLSLNDDSHVCASYDFTLFDNDEETSCTQTISMLSLFAKITSSCIPTIMRVIWKDSGDDSLPEQSIE